MGLPPAVSKINAFKIFSLPTHVLDIPQHSLGVPERMKVASIQNWDAVLQIQIPDLTL
jgi:hypothetical protein